MIIGYKRPEHISHIGGTDDRDARIVETIRMLSVAPLDEAHTVLDVGMGRGQMARWLAGRGKKVVGTGLEIDSYDCDLQQLKHDCGIEVVECPADDMPFEDGSFDAVLMSHVLEHCPNVGLALGEARRVLRDDGWLLVFVPQHGPFVAAGHVSVGWNVGQLIYVLLVNGFDVRSGHFANLSGFNVAGFARKRAVPLPPLRGDRGDISILASEGLLPPGILADDGACDTFFADMKSVNWPADHRIRVPLSRVTLRSAARLTFLACAHVIPVRLRVRAVDILVRTALLLSVNRPKKERTA